MDKSLILTKSEWGRIFDSRKFILSSYSAIFVGFVLCIVNGIPGFAEEGFSIKKFYSLLVFICLIGSAIGVYLRNFYFIPISILAFNAAYVLTNLYNVFVLGNIINNITVCYSVMYYIINAIMFRLPFVLMMNAAIFVFVLICSAESMQVGVGLDGSSVQPFLVNAIILSAAGLLLQHLVLSVRAMLIEQLGAVKLQVVALEAEMALEIARKDAREKAIQLNRISVAEALGASIAHEINQPIAAALTYCQAARNWSAIECAGGAPETLQALSGVESNVDRAARLIENIRRLTTNKDRSYVAINVHELVRDQVNLIHGEFERRGIRLTMVPVKAEISAIICPTEVALATMNLLRNAMEAFELPTSAPTVAIECRQVGDDWIEIVVVDNGRGLSPEGIQRAFGAFQSTKQAGAGIGLSICQEVAEHHSGSVSLAANLGGGVTATLRLASKPH